MSYPPAVFGLDNTEVIMPDPSHSPSSTAHAIAAEYARLREAKIHLTQVCNPEHRAEIRATIGEATARIWRLQRLAQPTVPRSA